MIVSLSRAEASPRLKKKIRPVSTKVGTSRGRGNGCKRKKSKGEIANRKRARASLRCVFRLKEVNGTVRLGLERFTSGDHFRLQG